MQEEKYNHRDLHYSSWHRRKSTSRFIGVDRAEKLSMIDIDSLEYNYQTRCPVALIETAQDVGQERKSTTVTSNLAELAGIPCYLVLYTLSENANAANDSWLDIESFRVKRIWPRKSDFVILTPKEWCEYLEKLRKLPPQDTDVFELAQKLDDSYYDLLGGDDPFGKYL